MKTLIYSALLAAPLFLAGCGVTTHDTGYVSDTVYTVGYSDRVSRDNVYYTGYTYGYDYPGIYAGYWGAGWVW